MNNKRIVRRRAGYLDMTGYIAMKNIAYMEANLRKRQRHSSKKCPTKRKNSK